GRVTAVNAAAERLLGWPEADLRGQDVYDTLHVPEANGLPLHSPAGRPAEVASWTNAIRKDDIRLRRKDGATVPVACQVSPVVEDGRVAGAVVAFREVEGARRRAGEPASAAREELFLRWARRIGPVAARIREAMQPLHPRFREDAQLREAGETIDHEARGLTFLADSFRCATRISRSNAPLPRRPVELEAVVGKAVEASRFLVEARRQYLTVVLPLEPAWLLADPDTLAQGLASLLDHT